MSYRISPWPWMVKSNPDHAKAELRAALYRADGVVGQAAKHVGLSVRSFWYYVGALGMQAELQSIRDEARVKKARHLKRRT